MSNEKYWTMPPALAAEVRMNNHRQAFAIALLIDAIEWLGDGADDGSGIALEKHKHPTGERKRVTLDRAFIDDYKKRVESVQTAMEIEVSIEPDHSTFSVSVLYRAEEPKQ